MRNRRIIALVLSLLLVSVAALAEDAVYTIADPTYVRSAPGIDGERKANLRPDSIYEWGGHTSVDDRGVTWFDVFYGNNYGWVSSLHADLYDRMTGEFSYYVNYPAPDDTTVFAKRDMDVYSGPSTETYFNGTLSKGESAIFTGFREKDSKGNEWLQIRYNWKRGWVRSKYAEIY